MTNPLRDAVEALLHTARHPREVYRGRGLERIAEVDANALDALRAALSAPPSPAEGEREARLALVQIRNDCRWMDARYESDAAYLLSVLHRWRSLAVEVIPASPRPPSTEAPRPEEVRCATFGGSIPPEVRARMDADRKAAEASAPPAVEEPRHEPTCRAITHGGTTCTCPPAPAPKETPRGR